jgi:hypothetical protein
MARLSDYMSQSIYSDSIDPTLSSDPFFLEPSEPTESQQTESQSTKLTSLPLLLPPSIQRTGGRTQQWALWTEMTKADFIEWWLTTQYGTSPKAKLVFWDGKRLKSDIWSSFDQIANIQTGQPKVICKQCGSMFGHPSSHGTNTLRRHKSNGSCQKSKGKQPNIEQSIQKKVCLLVR